MHTGGKTHTHTHTHTHNREETDNDQSCHSFQGPELSHLQKGSFRIITKQTDMKKS